MTCKHNPGQIHCATAGSLPFPRNPTGNRFLANVTKTESTKRTTWAYNSSGHEEDHVYIFFLLCTVIWWEKLPTEWNPAANKTIYWGLGSFPKIYMAQWFLLTKLGLYPACWGCAETSAVCAEWWCAMQSCAGGACCFPGYLYCPPTPVSPTRTRTNSSMDVRKRKRDHAATISLTSKAGHVLKPLLR